VLSSSEVFLIELCIELTVGEIIYLIAVYKYLMVMLNVPTVVQAKKKMSRLAIQWM